MSPAPRCRSWLALLITVAAAPAQAQFGALARGPRLPVDSDETYAVSELCDLDGDGDGDLVMGIEGGRDHLYLNDGNGVFVDAPATRFPASGDWTVSVAVGDVDGDLDIDVVVGNVDDPNKLYLNDGTGTFVDASAGRLPADNSTFELALGDVDGDRDLDLVVARGAAVRMYRNDGRGTFADASVPSGLPQAGDFWALALADLDGDRDLDVVVGSYGGPSQLWFNNGLGVFTDLTAARLPGAPDVVRKVEVIDVDRDHDPDLVFGREAQNKLYTNDGTGRFVDATTGRMPINGPLDAVYGMASGDVDEDGDQDLVVNRGLYLNDGRGAFTHAPARIPDFDRSAKVVLGDVDGDGDLDLILGISSGSDQLFTNLLRQVHTPQPPRIAQGFAIDAYAGPGLGGADRAFALWIGPVLRPGVFVPLFGNLRLDWTRMVALPTLTVPGASGTARRTLVIPNDAMLVGVQVGIQGLAVPADPLASRLTNAVDEIVAR